MVKIYLQKGLSSRVRNAIARRLQSAMAVRPEAGDISVEEGAAAEVPTAGAEQAAEVPQEAATPVPEEKEDSIGEHGEFSWAAAEANESRHRDRSRSPPKGPSVSAVAPSALTSASPAPVGDGSTLAPAGDALPSAPTGEASGSVPIGGRACMEVTPEQASILKEAIEKPKSALRSSSMHGPLCWHHDFGCQHQGNSYPQCDRLRRAVTYKDGSCQIP